MVLIPRLGPGLAAAGLAATLLAVGPAEASPGADTAGDDASRREETVAERRGSERKRRRPWYLPDRLGLQLAGNIGFLSPGVGYDLLDRHLEGDLFLGWVPEALGGDIFSLTGKLAVRPLSIRAGRFELWPARISLQLTYTFGDRYFLVAPDRYPDRYYPFPTALHAGLGVGAAAAWRPPGWNRRLGAYGELVALDSMLVAWARNPRALGPGDAFSAAVGVFLEL